MIFFGLSVVPSSGQFVMNHDIWVFYVLLCAYLIFEALKMASSMSQHLYHLIILISVLF